MDVKQQELSKVVEKDLDFVFTLMTLDEGTDRDEQIWGALIKRSYDKQVIRRLYVRTLFSFVESILSNIRTEALSAASKFTPQELMLLAGSSYDLSEKGEITERAYRGQLKKNLKFAFRCAAKAAGVHYEPHYDGLGWHAFTNAVSIRNRITHPTDPDSMEISDDEQRTIDTAHDWFIETYKGLLSARIGRLRAQLKKQRRQQVDLAK